MNKMISFCTSLWHVIHVSLQMIKGMWHLSRVPAPIVSIFGGSRFPETDYYFKQAHAFARRLVMANISVITGGGPGIMEAINCGITSYPGFTIARSIGIGVTELGEGPNLCVQEYFELKYFFARKWLMVRYSIGFIVFPGGFGTLDELFEVLTLIQTKKLRRVPVVLIGTEYWHPLLAWFKAEGIKHGVLISEEIELFTITDDLDIAFCLIRDTCSISQKNNTVK